MIRTPTLGPGSVTMRRALAYIRVSSERQAGEDSSSLADQRASIELLARRLGATVERWFDDPGVSGATAERRPGFMSLVVACEADPQPRTAPGLVLLLNASRLGRFDDPEEGAYWRVRLRRSGWQVHFAEGDAEGDAAPIVRAVQGLEATTYRRNLIANTRRGMRGAAELGFWSREAPYGYRREVVLPASARRVLARGELKTSAEKVRLTPHDAEAQNVRWAYETYAAGGISLGGIAAELKRREPGRRWSRTVVQHLLRSDAYRGAVVGGRRRDGGGELYGREDAHQPLVSAELWQAAQQRLARNAKLGPAIYTDYLLTGLLACPHCGRAYTGGGGGRKATRTRTCRRFYRDSGGVDGICPGRIGTVMRHLIDDAAVSMMTETISAPATRRLIERTLDAALARAAAAGAGAAADAEDRAARRELERQHGRLVAAVRDGALLSADIGPDMEQIRRKLAALDAAAQARRFARGRAKALPAERDRLLGLVLDFPAQAARLTGSRLRDLLERHLGWATFDKVTRQMTLGIRPVPATASFALCNQGGPAERSEVGLIVRSTSLVQPGHDYRIAEAAEQVRRGRTA